MRVLISIKPEYAEKIFDGTKKYEFRKAIFKNPNITHVVVYASYPVQKVIGEFEIADILTERPEVLWRKTRKHSGISRDFFFRYFSSRERGYAIKIRNTRRYLRPKCIREDYQLTPPQSFCYLV